MSKFKVGDKVRLLPSAVNASIPFDEVGKTGVIRSDGGNILVLMDKPRKGGNYRIDWCVDSSQIERAIKPGQQLLFAFMEED